MLCNAEYRTDVKTLLLGQETIIANQNIILANQDITLHTIRASLEFHEAAREQGDHSKH